MKKILFLVCCFFSFSAFAFSVDPMELSYCPIADINSPAFCAQFREAAHCQCRELFPKKPAKYCDSIPMSTLYDMMITSTPSHTQEEGCKVQEPRTHVPYAVCMAHWNKYRSGIC